MAIRVSINDSAALKLNDKGKELLEQHLKLFLRVEKPEEYIHRNTRWDGRVVLPLFEVMNIFGPGLVHGMDCPFDIDIELIPNN